jgi:hypothetical protein
VTVSRESAIASVLTVRPDLENRSEHFCVADVDDFPEFEYVSIADEFGKPMVGGTTFVVADNGRVFECSGSLSPKANCLDIRNLLAL